jgi:arabinofuranosyltransferase
MAEKFSTARYLLFTAVCLAVLLGIVIHNAWLCDDAFITFRSVDNLLSGYGLVWNVGERVQAFTHPLWLFLLGAGAALTSSLFFTAFALGILCTGVAFVLLARAARFRPAFVLVITAACGLSVAFTTFATSGLENPLVHILLASFFLTLLAQPEDPPPSSLFSPSLIMALLYLARPDAILLPLPLYVYGLLRVWSRERTGTNTRRILGWCTLGQLPAIGWSLFSLFYFGSIFPNTAHAKLNHGIPVHELVEIGWVYITEPIRNDPATALAIIAALLAAVAVRSALLLLSGLGIAVYLAYLVSIGGDFMAGRLLTLPFVWGLLMLSQLAWPKARRVWPLLLVFVAIAPRVWYRSVDFLPGPYIGPGPTGIVEERNAYYRHTSLKRWRIDDAYPDHRLAQLGRELRDESAVADSTLIRQVGSLGMAGYFAGPDVHIIDPLALADPLLARLPSRAEWRPGHFLRQVPCGYADAVAGTGEICDEQLAQYYLALKEVVAAELWSCSRLQRIWQLNLGRLEHLKENYVDHEIDN